ncbi:MAG: antibiotic biosynthesis monooxygenase [Candidatus Zixiibacteriota bacterium]
MTHVMIRHKVNDFDKWKKTFDEFSSFRKSSGEMSFQVMQHQEDSNNVYLMFEWDNEENARKFFGSAELKERMQKAGVAEAPEINFLNQADRGKL